MKEDFKIPKKPKMVTEEDIQEVEVIKELKVNREVMVKVNQEDGKEKQSYKRRNLPFQIFPYQCDEEEEEIKSKRSRSSEERSRSDEVKNDVITPTQRSSDPLCLEETKTYGEAVLETIYETQIPAEVKVKCQVNYCQLCPATLSNSKNARVHYMGRPHQRKLEAFCGALGKNVPKLKAIQGN